MTKYMVLYNATASAAEQMANASAEEMKAGMDAWMAWADNAGAAVVDLGMPVQAKRRVTAAGEMESPTEASGYSILQGSDADEVTTLLAKHPHLQMPGASIDVLEILPMPGS